MARTAPFQFFPSYSLIAQVPSGYFLTDVMLKIDALFDGKFLMDPTGKMNKLELAANEGVKLKNLVGALRGLWRSSKTGNHPRVTELKALLKPSPRKTPVASICHVYILFGCLFFGVLRG